MSIKSLGKQILNQDNENQITKKLFDGIDKHARILDVGSGKGRNIRLLNEFGFSNVLGVEINQDLVDFANKNNLNTISVDNFSKQKELFDVILFSHIIEHFSHNDLLAFLEHYFSYTKDGAEIVVLTPLESNFFYNDFDHVKPYHPQGIEAVFSNQLEQVQFSSRFYLDLQDIYFRKMPFRFLVFSRKIHLGKVSLPYVLVNVLSVFAWLLTGKLLGRVTGWGARYRIHHKPNKMERN